MEGDKIYAFSTDYHVKDNIYIIVKATSKSKSLKVAQLMNPKLYFTGIWNNKLAKHNIKFHYYKITLDEIKRLCTDPNKKIKKLEKTIINLNNVISNLEEQVEQQISPRRLISSRVVDVELDIDIESYPVDYFPPDNQVKVFKVNKVEARGKPIRITVPENCVLIKVDDNVRISEIFTKRSHSRGYILERTVKVNSWLHTYTTYVNNSNTYINPIFPKGNYERILSSIFMNYEFVVLRMEPIYKNGQLFGYDYSFLENIGVIE